MKWSNKNHLKKSKSSARDQFTFDVFLCIVFAHTLASSIHIWYFINISYVSNDLRDKVYENEEKKGEKIENTTHTSTPNNNGKNTLLLYFMDWFLVEHETLILLHSLLRYSFYRSSVCIEKNKWKKPKGRSTVELIQDEFVGDLFAKPHNFLPSQS